MYDVDVAFIGSGHACNHGAIALRIAGKSVAFIEEDKMGGTCTNYGCDAKILLDGPFEYMEGLKRYEGLCVSSVGTIDWPALMAYKKKVIGSLDPLLGQLFTKMGIETVHGHGTLTDAHTVKVGDRTVTAEYIVIGTGQRDAILPVPGKEYIHDSKDFLSIDEMPDHIVFLGAGIISMEFASMALMLGKQVTIIEFAPRALAAYPEQYVSDIVKKMESQGAVFHFNAPVSEVVRTDSGFEVRTSNGITVQGDYVLGGTGRVANVEDLGLEGLGIEASKRGIKVDDHLRTSVPNIYASGDVVDSSEPKLTPVAEFDSNYIAAQILGLSTEPIRYPVIPNLVFTLPRIAQVGVPSDAAAKEPEKYRVVPVPYGPQNEWIDNRETDISLTFVIDKEGHLAGAAVYGSDGGPWIDFLTLIINEKLTGADLRRMIFAFPTQTYMLVSTLVPLLQPA
ncbi:MAG: NAD(P)/FAD-dependent oxidoreductase [Clostridia bacterium]|nr:NAD(P)/FAD-dependent oxidoreductase [Clostridia bacterium]